MLELYWDDLTDEAKQKVIDMLGDNMNWDIVPIVQIES